MSTGKNQDARFYGIGEDLATNICCRRCGGRSRQMPGPEPASEWAKAKRRCGWAGASPAGFHPAPERHCL